MMITAPDRPHIAKVADERAKLDAWLDYQRDTLAIKCAGLTPDQMRERAVPPSSISMIGLLRHMTLVEMGWVYYTLTGGQELDPPYYSKDRPGLDFDDIETQDPDDAYRRWQEMCDQSRKRAEGIESLDHIAAQLEGPNEDEPTSLRWIMVHMIEEYARHNGHADFLRERIDGVTGM